MIYSVMERVCLNLCSTSATNKVFLKKIVYVFFLPDKKKYYPIFTTIKHY